MKYRIRHTKDGTEIGFYERSRIDTASNVCSMLVDKIRRAGEKSFDDAAIKAAWDHVHSLTKASFIPLGIVNVECDGNTIRIDAC